MLLSPLLQEYLVENGYLPLPDVGQLTIQQTPAQLKTADQIFVASASKIVFSDKVPAESELQQLTVFIATKLNLSKDETTGLLQKQMSLYTDSGENTDAIDWPEWNLFADKEDETLLASQQSFLNDYLPSFPIEKIHGQPVTVTETTTLPIEIISEELYPVIEDTAPVDYLWVWALVIFIVSVLLIMFRYA